jgi:hypothetical protein
MSGEKVDTDGGNVDEPPKGRDRGALENFFGDNFEVLRRNSPH